MLLLFCVGDPYGEILRSRSRVVALAQRMESEPSFALTFNLDQSILAESNRLVTLGALVALKVDILNTLKVQPRYAF